MIISLLSRLTSQYRIDYSSFNKVYKVDTPRCSAKQLDQEDSCADDEDAVDERPPTVVTVLPSSPPADHTKPPLPRFLQQSQLPYERSFASMVPPFPSVSALATAMNKRDWVVNSCELGRAAAAAAGPSVTSPSRRLRDRYHGSNSRQGPADTTGSAASALPDKGCGHASDSDQVLDARQVVSHLSLPCLQQPKDSSSGGPQHM